LSELGAAAFGAWGATEVIRHDALTMNYLEQRAPQVIVISPKRRNPSDPAYLGVRRRDSWHWHAHSDAEGVPCLGHQGIAHALGGRIVRASEVMHATQPHFARSLVCGRTAQGFVIAHYHAPYRHLQLGEDRERSGSASSHG